MQVGNISLGLRGRPAVNKYNKNSNPKGIRAPMEMGVGLTIESPWGDGYRAARLSFYSSSNDHHRFADDPKLTIHDEELLQQISAPGGLLRSFADQVLNSEVSFRKKHPHILNTSFQSLVPVNTFKLQRTASDKGWVQWHPDTRKGEEYIKLNSIDLHSHWLYSHTITTKLISHPAGNGDKITGAGGGPLKEELAKFVFSGPNKDKMRKEFLRDVVDFEAFLLELKKACDGLRTKVASLR